MTTQVQDFQIHVRFQGNSYAFDASNLDIGNASTDEDVKRQVAGELGTDESNLDGYVVDRHENGNITVRPQARFGGYFSVVRSDQEIEDMYVKAGDAAMEGTKYPGMSYEEGIREVLAWLTDKSVRTEEVL